MSDLRTLLADARQQLSGCVDQPRLDAEVLLAHALGRDRSWLYARPEHVPVRTEIDEHEAVASAVVTRSTLEAMRAEEEAAEAELAEGEEGEEAAAEGDEAEADAGGQASHRVPEREPGHPAAGADEEGSHQRSPVPRRPERYPKRPRCWSCRSTISFIRATATSSVSS